MTVRPKSPKPSKADEKAAYRAATERDSDTCQRCLRDCGMGVTSRHHRKGRGVGGRTEIQNLVILGGTGTTGCHGFITMHPAEALAEGWVVPGFAEPADWPQRRWLNSDHGMKTLAWVLLSEDAFWIEITSERAADLMGGN